MLRSDASNDRAQGISRTERDDGGDRHLLGRRRAAGPLLPVLRGRQGCAVAGAAATDDGPGRQRAARVRARDRRPGGVGRARPGPAAADRNRNRAGSRRSDRARARPDRRDDPAPASRRSEADRSEHRAADRHRSRGLALHSVAVADHATRRANCTQAAPEHRTGSDSRVPTRQLRRIRLVFSPRYCVSGRRATTGSDATSCPRRRQSRCR